MRGTTVPSRFAFATAVLIGSWVALGCASDAEAVGCHATDRPVFGLSDGRRDAPIPSPAPPRRAVSDEGEGSRVIPRHCPDDSPDGPSRRVQVDRDGSMALAIAPAPLVVGLLAPEADRARPILRRDRIERPPRSS